MVISDLGAADMMIIGVLDGLFPLLFDPFWPMLAGDDTAGLIAAEDGLGASFLFLGFPSVTLRNVMPEKVPVVSILKPCASLA